jgi:NitT/TauT family transport system substrate-binding protein
MRGSRFALAALAACLAAHAAAADAIRVAVQRIATQAPIFVALERGYFAAEGLDAQLIYFEAATPMAIAAAAGDVDFGVTGLSAGIYSLAGQGQIRIIGGYVREVPGFQSNTVFASNRAWAAGLKGYKEIAGHSVAVTQVGSAPHYVLGLLADKFGFDIAGVRVLPLQSNPNAVAAVSSGQADVGIIPVTFVTPALERGDVKLIGYAGDVVAWQLGAAFTTTRLADQRGDIVNGFLRAYRKGSRDYCAAFIGPDGKRIDGPTAPDLLAIMAKYTGQPVAVVRQGLGYLDAAERLDVKDVLHQIAWYKTQKLLKPDIDGDAIIDKRYVVPLP